MGLAESKGFGMMMLEPVVLRSLPSETPHSATACTFPAEGISINFLVVAIAALTLLATTRGIQENTRFTAGGTRGRPRSPTPRYDR